MSSHPPSSPDDDRSSTSAGSAQSQAQDHHQLEPKHKGTKKTHDDQEHQQEHQEEEDSDDPIDLLSSKLPSRFVSRRDNHSLHLDSSSKSSLNPISPLAVMAQSEPDDSLNHDLDLLVGRFNTLGVSEVKRRRWRRNIPASLTAGQMEVVREALSAEEDKTYDLPGARCGIEELQRLAHPLRWLNDEIINFYGVLINRLHLHKPVSKPVYCFSTFFLDRFDSDGHPAVRRWTKNVDLLEKHLVLFPINLQNLHWVLGAINPQDKRFEYYDSLGGRNPDVLSKLRRYWSDESRDKKDVQVDLTGWVDYQPKVPRQSNGADCGLFVCQLMYSLSENLFDHDPVQTDDDDQPALLVDFTAQDMPYFRQKMIFEIVTKQFVE